MAAKSFDMIVIGAGPGGYVAAIRGAQLGLNVAIVEREHMGGICLNWGCIPTKAMLRSSEVFHLMHRAKEFGLKAENVDFDLPAVVKRSRQVARVSARTASAGSASNHQCDSNRSRRTRIFSGSEMATAASVSHRMDRPFRFPDPISAKSSSFTRTLLCT